MVYFEGIGRQGARFPVPGAVPQGVSLCMRSTVDNAEFDVPFVAVQGGRLYVAGEVTLPDTMQPGEYEWRLSSGGKFIATGLAVIGGGGADRKEYERKIEYRQYGV